MAKAANKWAVLPALLANKGKGYYLRTKVGVIKLGVYYGMAL